MTATDSVLVDRCRSGDDEAWRHLVARFDRYVHAIVVHGYRLYGPDAEDVFQDVFLRAYEQLGRLRDASAIRPWLGQLTRRRCIDYLRSRQPEPLGELPDLAEIDARLERIEEALAVRDALGALPEFCQEILDRFFCRGESYAEISSALELPSGTIASRISRCLARLRHEYHRQPT